MADTTICMYCEGLRAHTCIPGLCLARARKMTPKPQAWHFISRGKELQTYLSPRGRWQGYGMGTSAEGTHLSSIDYLGRGEVNKADVRVH